MPTIGPIVTYRPWYDSLGSLTQYKYKWQGKGPRPIQPYYVDAANGVGPWNQLNAVNEISVASVMASNLYPVAYDRFWAKAVNKANLAVSLLEGRKSFQMIANRLTTLANCWRFLRRGDFKALNRALGVDTRFRPKTTGGKKPSSQKQLASSWLEYTFGWVPLIQDIWDGCNVLQQDFASFRCKVRVRNDYTGGHPWDGQVPPDYFGSAYGAQVQVGYTIGGHIRVTNPNLLLANQLGLTNPALVLWDRVPFSFVLDWFVPVGKFLRSFTQTQGLDITALFREPWVFVKSGWSAHGIRSNPVRGPISGRWADRRVGALTPPDLLSRFKFPKLDPWIAVTAISLFTQVFGK